jgi:hypothetical protein
MFVKNGDKRVMKVGLKGSVDTNKPFSLVSVEFLLVLAGDGS